MARSVNVSEGTRDHFVMIAQDGFLWRAVCGACPWRYEGTSPSVTWHAAQRHPDIADDEEDAEDQADEPGDDEYPNLTAQLAAAEDA